MFQHTFREYLEYLRVMNNIMSNPYKILPAPAGKAKNQRRSGGDTTLRRAARRAVGRLMGKSPSKSGILTAIRR
jgi:hypothetical protein